MKKINPEDVKVISTPAEDFPAGATSTIEIKNDEEFKKGLKELVRRAQAVHEAMVAVDSFDLEYFSRVRDEEEEEVDLKKALEEIKEIESAIDLVNQYLIDGSECSLKSIASIEPFMTWLHRRKKRIKEEVLEDEE